MPIMPHIRNNRWIPRKTLTARTRQAVKKGGSVFSNVGLETEYKEFELLQCTVQPIKGQDRQVLPEGIRDAESYKVFSETPVISVEEDTNNIGDQILIDGVTGDAWFTAYTVKKWQVGLIPHYEIHVVKEPDE